MHRFSRLFVAALAICFTATFAPNAGAQDKCTDANIVGTATAKERLEAMKEADGAWQKDAVAKLGVKAVFHQKPRAKCAAKKGEYTCTVTAKACDKAQPRTGVAARSSCWPSGECEICCGGPSDLHCYPQCK